MFEMLVAAPPVNPVAGPVPSIGQPGGDYNKRYAKLHEGLDSSISSEGKGRIERIIHEVQLLTDVEKLLLYLKLPTGVPKDEYLRTTPPSCLPVSNRKEQGEAITWIKSHLEEHGEVCMPKAEVYEEYKQYCIQHDLRPLCNADFGKVMKTVYPDINTRRLGQRGQSKYFYGGLRKKLDHMPPGLSELEIHSKTTETEENKTDTEMFKSSCKLVCEWADKLLENKFSGIQAIAEHLVANMYVNTKSMAAFTLIAAMQESGNQNLKGLFNSQTNSLDKHKETNLLLQQKLHKNKVLQKQKEKLQAMKEENGQNQTQGILAGPPFDRKNASSNSRKSSTPSKMARTPKVCSPIPSSTESPVKYPSSDVESSSKHMVSIATTKIPDTSLSWNAQSDNTIQDAERPIVQNAQSNLGESQRDVSVSKITREEHLCSSSVDTSDISVKDSLDSNDITMSELQEESDSVLNRCVNSSRITLDVKPEVDSSSANSCTMVVSSNTEIEMGPRSSRETPSAEMEVNTNSLSHVRKISFEDVGDRILDHSRDVSKAASEQTECKHDDNNAKVDMLSKSAGHMSLKMLLERKSTDNQSTLNKSTGLLEKSKNGLLVNQSNIAGRSAFVPFAQVQQPRRDPVDTSQSTPFSMASSVQFCSEKSTHSSDVFTPEKLSQSSYVTATDVPKCENVSDNVTSCQLWPDNILKIFPGAAVQLTASSRENVPLAFPVSDTVTSPSAKTSINDSLTILTTSTSLASSLTSETIVSTTQSSPGIAKHLRTRFTPIRPKGSPNKATTAKDSKSDNPVYDKRPVSEILKEKRAKEQAEAIAKIQAGINLPPIPFQPSISLSSGSFSGFQQLQGVAGKEVVIIVNNQAGGNINNLVKRGSILPQTLVDLPQERKADCKEIHVDVSNSVAKQSAHQDCRGKVDNQVNTGKKNDSLRDAQEQDLEKKDTKADKQLFSSSDDMEVESDGINNSTEQQVTNDSASTILVNTEQEQRDQFEQIYTETPAKIARLNITSPLRPDSACSLGRETPLRITKHPDSCSSRPESACSYGRETPSGARKRKSSDYQQRKDFKRLNSTGDDVDEVCNEGVLTELLSPSVEGQSGDSHRRTQSCTFELDRDVRLGLTFSSKPPTTILPEGLQSPDIRSLEEEALIESFPNSLYMLRPHKSQRHSIGVSARSVKASQQRLLKQKQILDKQVGTFLQHKQPNADLPQTAYGSQDCGNSQPDFKVPFKSPELTKDSVRESRNSKLTPGQTTNLLSAKTSHFDNEPSGLPSDVADWINETIEKRRTLNQSVLSEPELGDLVPQRSSTAIDFMTPQFHFEVDHEVRARSSQSRGHSENTSLVKDAAKVSNTSMFTVPKAPSFTLRVKDLPQKSRDTQHLSQRCQSLPMFTSTSRSPVSPISLPANKLPLYQRAVSMSPGQQVEGQRGQMHLLSPVSGLTSPLRRIEVRDNHPISVNVLTGSSVTPSTLVKVRDESAMKYSSYGNIGKQNSIQVDEGRGHVGSYLASIQHNLQKPKDTGTNQDSDLGKSREPGFVITSSNSVLGSNINTGQSLSNNNQVNQSGLPENNASQAQFSDSGYQSSGPSPVLKSTPVSGVLDGVLNLPRMSMTRTAPDSQITTLSSNLQQDSLVSPNIPVTCPDTSVRIQMDGKHIQSSITSSKTSAFIPIQSSHQNAHFITPTPIRPTVSLPNQMYQITTQNYSNQSNLCIDPNQSSFVQDVPMISPKGHDPPPYEAAVKSLRQSNMNVDGGSSTWDRKIQTSYSVETEMEIEGDSPFRKDTEPHNKKRVSLLANMGKEYDTLSSDSFGPFATKLVQLSRQTKSSSFKPSLKGKAGHGVTKIPGSQISPTLTEKRITTNTPSQCSNAGFDGKVYKNVYRNDAVSALSEQIPADDRLYGPGQVDMINAEQTTGDLTSDGLSFNQSVVELVGNCQSNENISNNSCNNQSNEFIVSQEIDNKTAVLVTIQDRAHPPEYLNSENRRQNTNSKGANILMSPKSEQSLSPLVMDIDFLQRPESQSSLHLSSSPGCHDNVLFSTNPSFHPSLNRIHSAQKDISNTTLSSQLTHSQVLENMDKQVHISSNNFLTESDQFFIGEESKHELQMQTKEYVEMNVEDSGRVNIADIRRYSEQRVSDPVLCARGEAGDDIPVDLDLMLQDLKDLESDLLQENSGLNI